MTSANMNLTFVSSIVHPKDGPRTGLPEFAFIGRSNVGKSSLINMIAGRKNLAKTSSSPGKTRTINHFLEPDKLYYIVDLPGYGYAKLSKDERAKLEQVINAYLLKSNFLRCTFILVDSRHEPQKPDLAFISWMMRNGRRFVILFTKTDKLTKADASRLIASYRKEVRKELPDFDPVMLKTSATTREGRDEIIEMLNEMMST